MNDEIYERTFDYMLDKIGVDKTQSSWQNISSTFNQFASQIAPMLTSLEGPVEGDIYKNMQSDKLYSFKDYYDGVDQEYILVDIISGTTIWVDEEDFKCNYRAIEREKLFKQ